MIDRESIIDHLDEFRMFADLIVRPLVSPENRNVYSKLCNYIDLIKDEVETLLKEQEPALPTWSQGRAYCGNCGQRLPRKSVEVKEGR